MTKLWKEPYNINYDGIAEILSIGLLILPFAMIGGYYNSRSRMVEETERDIVFQPSTNFNQGRVRAYDFNKDGQLDKVESASFCYRPTIFAWHNVDRNSPFYSGAQKEYSELLNSRDYQRAKDYERKVKGNKRKLFGR